MADKTLTSSLDAPAGGAVAITPSDVADLTDDTRGIIISSVAGGDAMAVTMANGDTVTFSGLLTGVVYPFRLRRIFLTGTTVTGIIGLY